MYFTVLEQFSITVNLGEFAASSLQDIFGSISVAPTVLYGASIDKVTALTPGELTD